MESASLATTSEICMKCTDIVITDIRMPQMNGFEVARAVKEIRLDIKIALITTFDINKSEFEKVLPSTNVDAFIEISTRYHA